MEITAREERSCSDCTSYFFSAHRMTSWSNFVASGTVWMRSLWAKKLRSCLGDLHSFLTVCELYSPMRSTSSLTNSNNLAHFDRLCSFTLSRCDISPNFAQSTKPRKWSNLGCIWSLLSKMKRSACLCSSLITCLTLFPLPVRPGALHFYSNWS